VTHNLVDYHVHSVSHGEIECTEENVTAFLESARKRNIVHVGFTDHEQFLSKVDYSAILRGSANVPEVSVRVGVEVNYFPERETKIHEFVNSLKVDYVMGSVHNIGDWAFDNPRNLSQYDKWNIDDLYKAYFDRIRMAAETGLFNIIGHLDIIKIFGFRPKRSVMDHAMPALEAIRRRGAAIEINTNGKYKPVEEIYPSTELLGKCFEMGIPVTLGSDAHVPENTGRDVEIAARMAKDAGYTKVAVFTEGKMDFLPL
jgi:histidinol-phosphatase (PHP family)